jgi:transcriptional regulator with XRE-family HTH domain
MDLESTGLDGVHKTAHPNPCPKSVGKQMRAQRKLLKLTLQKVADKLKTTRAAISQWELDGSQPRVEYRKQLEKILKMKLVFPKRPKFSILLGNEIRQDRINMGLHRIGLANRVGCNLGAIYYWEKGSVPKRCNLKKLSRILKKNYEEFLRVNHPQM